MFKHLFKLIWNKKKQNFLLISEMLISFMVIFAVFTLIVNYYSNYKKPMGYDYNHQWVINYSNSISRENMNQFYDNLKQTLKAMPQIDEVSWSSGNIPFSFNQNGNGIDYKQKHFDNINWYNVDDGYKDALNVKVLEGRWFNKQDEVATNQPVVINETFKEMAFGSEDPLGKILGNSKDKERDKKRVIGVVADMKMKGDYKPAGTGVYARLSDTSYAWTGTILLKVNATADAAFESHLYKTVSNAMKNSNVEIEHLTIKRTKMNQVVIIPAIVMLVIACFLIINVALGLFGVLWYNISRRRAEIGLRRAIGATGKSVSGQLVAESLILATISLIVGLFFAVQFPLLNVFDVPRVVYIVAILLAILFIYLLVLVCSLYPGRQAAAIYPAVALHEE